MAGSPPARPARDVLAAKRLESTRAILDLTHDFQSVVRASTDTNADDEHDPEGSTIAFERAQLAALLDSARHELDEIDSALDRLDTGGYGWCEHCGVAIASERLLARPAARQCVTCAAGLA